MSTDVLIRFKEKTQNLPSENFNFSCKIAVTEAISNAEIFFDSVLSVFDRTSRVFCDSSEKNSHFNAIWIKLRLFQSN